MTFFVLGWLAERLPSLVREIADRGHEVASHGYNHELCNTQSFEHLKQDLVDSRKRLEDITGAPVCGYRAPSFSINDDILKIVQESGYLYDSSYNSFAMHGRYGKVSLSSNGTTGIAINVPRSQFKSGYPRSNIQHSTSKIQNSFCELPISNLNIRKPFNGKGFVLPWGGGGYFRLIPFFLFKRGVESILKKDGAYVFYMHPWEIDPGQPRVNAANRSYKFRHYINLDKTFSRLKRILQNFNFCRFSTCSEYLNVQQDSSFKTQNPSSPFRASC